MSEQQNLRAANSEFKKKIIELDLKVETLVSEKNALASQLNERMAEVDRWRSKADAHQGKIAEMEKQRQLEAQAKEETKEEVEKKEEPIITEDQITDIILESRGWELAARAMEKSACVREEDVEKMKKEIEELRAELETSKAELRNRNEVIQKLKEEIERAGSADLLQKTGPLLDFKVNLDILESQKDQDAMKEIEKLKTELEEARKATELSEKQNELSPKKFEALRQQYYQKLKEKDKIIEQRQDQIETLEFQREERKITMKRLQIDSRQKANELKHKDEELKNSLNLCSEQHIIIKNLSIESEALRKTVQNMEGTVEFTEKENEKIQSRMKKMEKELAIAKEDIHKRENRLKAAYKQNDELKAQLDKERKRMRSLREKQSQDLDQKLRAKDTEITVLKEMVKSAQIQIKAKESQLKRAKKLGNSPSTSLSKRPPKGPQYAYREQRMGDMGHSDSQGQLFPVIGSRRQGGAVESTPPSSHYRHPAASVQKPPPIESQIGKMYDPSIRKSSGSYNQNPLIDMQALQRPPPDVSSNPLLNDMSALNAATFPTGFGDQFPSTGGISNFQPQAATMPPVTHGEGIMRSPMKVQSPPLYQSTGQTGVPGIQRKNKSPTGGLHSPFNANPQFRNIPATIQEIRETPTQGMQGMEPKITPTPDIPSNPSPTENMKIVGLVQETKSPEPMNEEDEKEVKKGEEEERNKSQEQEYDEEMEEEVNSAHSQDDNKQ